MQKRRRVRVLLGIFFLCTGIFFTILLVGFHPLEARYFSGDSPENASHFLGIIGVQLAGFLFHSMGSASYMGAFFFIYTGYILLKHYSTLKRIGYLFVALSMVFSFTGMVSIIDSPRFYGGGGTIGNMIVKSIEPHSSRNLMMFIFILLLSVGLFFTFKNPLQSIYRIFTQLRKRKNGSLPDVGSQDNVGSQYNGLSLHEARRNRKAKKQMEKSRIKRRRRRKPPLIQRVYYSEDMALSRSSLQEKRGRDESGSLYEDSKREKQPDFPISLELGKSGAQQEQQKVIMEGPDVSLLKKSKTVNKREVERETLQKAKELEQTLKDFGIEARVVGIIRGPVITRYELQPAPGVKLSRIVNLSDNIALSLSANGVRIEAPIPGRSAVGIEIPNEMREIVTLGDIIEEAGNGGDLPLILGKDISGRVVVSDLSAMPHLLIAGATGSGKSVCVNSLIMSLLYRKTPQEVKFIMIDPKMVELKIYNGIPHLLTDVVTDPRDAAKALRWVIREMENRYRLFDQYYARDINGYNKKAKEKMFSIIIIVDEFANLMAITQKEVEDAVVRLAAMSRAVGIHLIMATQRPSVDVITGLIKANFPYRIAFQVASKTDSRTIMDTVGAEKLMGKGDMLFSPAGSMNVQRIQGAYISEDEVLAIVDKLKSIGSQQDRFSILNFEETEESELDYDDPIFDESVEIVLKTKRASASFLQRRLKIGYNRAARLIEMMEEKGIIGPQRGSKPREIYIDSLD